MGEPGNFRQSRTAAFGGMVDSEIRHSVTKDNIRNILEFLPKFEEPDFDFGEWVPAKKLEDGVIQIGFYAMSDAALKFLEVLDTNGFIVGEFAWTQEPWKSEAMRFMDDPDLVARSDLDTLIKLLTTHSRADRFNEGHLGKVLESGHILAILRRLQVLEQIIDRSD